VIPPKRWVAPFGDPRIHGRSPLPSAFRSVPRPSSPLGAKASTRCPSLELAHAQPQARPQAGLAEGRRQRAQGSQTGLPGPRPPPALRSPGMNLRSRRDDVPRRYTAYPCPGALPPDPNLGPAWHAPASRSRLASRCQRSQVGAQRPDPVIHPVTAPTRRFPGQRPRRRRRPQSAPEWWAWADLNGRPHAYQACALTS
jgi:hypothetical protein